MRAVFLDRDGVLIDDAHLLTEVASIRTLPGSAAALGRLKRAGFLLVVISNQTVVSRGLLSESAMRGLHADVEQLLQREGAPPLDGSYYCPHHPKATMAEYRKDCTCRKPRPGLLLRAAEDRQVDLSASFMVGDRISDIIAGASAGCRTILVQTGMHLAPPIETSEPVDWSIRPDHICASLAEAADWILEVM